MLKVKRRWKAKPLICLWLSYAVFLSSAWKNVGMTVTWNRCDVMTIIWQCQYVKTDQWFSSPSHFSRLLSFCSLTRGITQTIFRLCFVLIKSILLNLSYVWILSSFQSTASYTVAQVDDNKGNKNTKCLLAFRLLEELPEWHYYLLSLNVCMLGG